MLLTIKRRSWKQPRRFLLPFSRISPHFHHLKEEFP